MQARFLRRRSAKMISWKRFSLLSSAILVAVMCTAPNVRAQQPPVRVRPIYPSPKASVDNQNERKPGEPIVPYNHVWRAGANEATMFQVTDDVLINGQPLKAGT